MTKNVKMAQKWPKMAQSRRKWSGLVKMVKKWVRDGEDGPKGAKRAIKKNGQRWRNADWLKNVQVNPENARITLRRPHHPKSRPQFDLQNSCIVLPCIAEGAWLPHNSVQGGTPNGPHGPHALRLGRRLAWRRGEVCMDPGTGRQAPRETSGQGLMDLAKKVDMK